MFHSITKKAEEDFISNYKIYFNNQSSVEIIDKKDSFYKNKEDSKIISKFLKNGWETKIEDFLIYSKNTDF